VDQTKEKLEKSSLRIKQWEVCLKNVATVDLERFKLEVKGSDKLKT
jgi:hypothetical protein